MASPVFAVLGLAPNSLKEDGRYSQLQVLAWAELSQEPLYFLPLPLLSTRDSIYPGLP